MKARNIVLCALVVSTAFPASAQMTGSRLRGPSGAMVASVGEPDLDPRPSDEAVRVLRGLTKCLVKSKRTEVMSYLASTTDMRQKAILARLSFSLSNCLENAEPGAAQISMGGPSFQGALAEALLAGQELKSLSPVEPSTTEVPHWLSDHPDQRVVEEMAICLSDRHPQESAELVQSSPGSPAESAAFNALTPLFGPCLIRGATLHANRVGIHLALADALYHRVTGPENGAPVSAEGRE